MQALGVTLSVFPYSNPDSFRRSQHELLTMKKHMDICLVLFSTTVNMLVTMVLHDYRGDEKPSCLLTMRILQCSLRYSLHFFNGSGKNKPSPLPGMEKCSLLSYVSVNKTIIVTGYQ